MDRSNCSGYHYGPNTLLQIQRRPYIGATRHRTRDGARGDVLIGILEFVRVSFC